MRVPEDEAGLTIRTGRRRADFCAVRRGTSILIAAVAYECSSFETPESQSEAELRQCAVDQQAAGATPTVVLDGKALTTTSVVTGLMRALPLADNIFGAIGPERSGLSVGSGSLVLVNGLKRGEHTIQLLVASVVFITTVISVT